MTSNIDSSLVTIGMPVYNGARYIRRALDSILTQNFSDFELIISDNASTDETSAICLEYAKRDGRIRYVRHERNSGAAVNYNFLLEATNSKYFFFAPHDDEWLADWVSAAVEALEESTNSSIVLGTIDFVNKENELVARVSPPWSLNQITPSERIRKYLNTEITDHLLYGVIRFNCIKNFRLGLGETSPERALIFTILASGRVADSTKMKMINHMSNKTQKELYEFFQFNKWYLANLKSHISVLRAFFRELQFLVAIKVVLMYLSEIVERKIFNKKRKIGNVQLYKS